MVEAMRVLVTGGTGFIGGYVCAQLEASGDAPTVLDRHGRLPWSFETVLGDVRDSAAVDAAVSHTQGVIHLAAVLGTQETVQRPGFAAEVNILGSLNVFEACVHYRVPCVYIGVGNHWMDNPYSISKTTAERFAWMFRKERGLRIAIVRAYNAYGPRQKARPVRKITPNLILPALKGEPIEVYGDGLQVMDMIHVRDVADVLVRAIKMDKAAAPTHVLEAGTGRKTTVLEIAKAVLTATRSLSPIDHLPMRPGETEHAEVVARPETLAPLGEFDFVRLEDGIQETVEWYRGART